MLFDEHINK